MSACGSTEREPLARGRRGLWGFTEAQNVPALIAMSRQYFEKWIHFSKVNQNMYVLFVCKACAHPKKCFTCAGLNLKVSPSNPEAPCTWFSHQPWKLSAQLPVPSARRPARQVPRPLLLKDRPRASPAQRPLAQWAYTRDYVLFTMSFWTILFQKYFLSFSAWIMQEGVTIKSNFFSECTRYKIWSFQFK